MKPNNNYERELENQGFRKGKQEERERILEKIKYYKERNFMNGKFKNEKDICYVIDEILQKINSEVAK